MAIHVEHWPIQEGGAAVRDYSYLAVRIQAGASGGTLELGERAERLLGGGLAPPALCRGQPGVGGNEVV